MKVQSIFFTACVLLLAACSQQTDKAPQGQENAQGGPQSAAPPAANEPQSKVLYEKSQKAYQQKNLDESEKYLLEAAAAARKENNVMAVILCAETQARLVGTAKKDTKKAAKILESVILEYSKSPSGPQLLERLDATRAVLASVYATSGELDKADKFYKGCIDLSRKQKNPKRTAFWLKQYSEFYKFKKDEKKSKQLEQQAMEEFKKG